MRGLVTPLQIGDPNSIGNAIASLGNTIAQGPQMQLMNQLRQAQLSGDQATVAKTLFDLGEAQKKSAAGDTLENDLRTNVVGPNYAADALAAGVVPDQAGGYQRVAAAPQGPRAPAVLNAQIAAGQPYSSTAQAFDIEQNKPMVVPMNDTLVDRTGKPIYQPQNASGTVAPGDTKLTGDAYLGTLSPAMAAQVKAIDEGRAPLPPPSSRSPLALGNVLRQALFQYDPEGYDFVVSGARQKAAQAYAPGGKYGANLTSLNQALAHLTQLYNQIPGTAGSNFPVVNMVENAAATATGQPGPGNYAGTAQNVANELTTLWRNGGGNEQDIRGYLQTIGDVNASQTQKQQAVQNIMSLIYSRMGILQGQYQEAMGPKTAPFRFLSPENAKAIATIGILNGTQVEKPDVSQYVYGNALGEAPAAPAAAPAQNTAPTPEEIKAELARRRAAAATAPQPVAIPLNMGAQ